MAVSTPEGWGSITLEELFTPEQLAVVMDHVSKRNVYGLHLYLLAIADELESKGVTPHYIYYALCYKFKLMD